jgi:D-alanyl-D-alanine carboxypeptidase (penicillin-binding protein 5/6)
MYPGALGGKIGWTSAAGATYVGMARRHGVTPIVTLLHCPALTEIDAGKSLLNWGFAVDGKVRPVGTLVGPLPPPGSTSASSRSGQQGTGQQADWAQPVASGGPSVLAAAGFSCVALLAAGIGFAYSAHSRRRRSRS